MTAKYSEFLHELLGWLLSEVWQHLTTILVVYNITDI